MAQMIPLFLAEEETSSSMARQRDCYDDLELVRRFRFSRVSISRITELIANYLNFTERSYAASPHLQVCVALQFFASGTFQIICGDGINVSQASASRYERQKLVGLVDGTHIRIQRPSEDEADYINRHFYHSINVQAICQPDGMFSDVLARFPGSVHDSRIWKISGVGMHVENTFSIGEHILGDSGYMMREARRTGGGPNEAGEVEDEDILILSSDRDLSTSVTERVSQMFSSMPAFTGICGSVDMFQAPTALPSHTEISETSEVTPVFEEPAEVTVVSSRPEGRRKRKRSIEQSTSVSDLLPLQREVLLKQMEVFSAQLQLIEEQREYYRHKKQRLLEKDQQQQL